MEIFICKFCNRETPNAGANKKHENRCHSNPDPKPLLAKELRKQRVNFVPWNKGLSKQTSSIVLAGSIKCSQTKKNKPGKPQSEESKRKISNTRKLLFNEGLLSGKNKIRYYQQHPEKCTHLYLVEFSNEFERFIKIGISELGIAERFRHSEYSNYAINVIRDQYINAYSAAMLEKHILRSFRKEFGYNPQNFNGRTECLEMLALDTVQEVYDKEILGYVGAGKDSKSENC